MIMQVLRQGLWERDSHDLYRIDFFDDGIWGNLVDTLTVNSRTDMVLRLKGGLEIKILSLTFHLKQNIVSHH